MSAACGFCGKPEARCAFGRMFAWQDGLRCVRCLRGEEQDAKDERDRADGRRRCGQGGADPWEDEWLWSPEFFQLLCAKAAKGRVIHSVLGGDVFACDTSCHQDIEAWVTPSEVIVALRTNAGPSPLSQKPRSSNCIMTITG